MRRHEGNALRTLLIIVAVLGVCAGLLNLCGLWIANQYFGSALHRSAAAGNLAGVKRCLAWKYDINDQAGWMHQTPLQYAIENHHLDVADYLLSRGADPNRQDVRGQTALTSALLTLQDDDQLIHKLLQAKADPNIRDRHGLAPLHYIVRCDHLNQNE